ncbi:hypothetical protein CALK_1457 [Chitinivibrio alkaliphilus ACht1]|uniref:Uncharacterized protein n=2 Tax=Chitinivibrio TaxID=1505231 RepID=U7D4Z9_9BACT|nr:hypothetical protein CALK_1457 [Chitinivibrio alkaliphilus ACht1]
MFTACFNPFFPSQNTPQGNLESTTPEEVITLLQESYEQRNITLFTTLMYDTLDLSSYIYVPPTSGLDFPYGAERLPDSIVFDETVPPDIQFIPLEFRDERRIHDNLFNRAEHLSFTRSMFIESVEYFSHTGSPLSAEDDYAYIVVQTGRAEIALEAPQLGDGRHTFTIQGQYFLLRRDEQNNLKIWKWIEYAE